MTGTGPGCQLCSWMLLTDCLTASMNTVREATPWNEGPRFLIRDNDSKFGQNFRLTLIGRGIEDVRLPFYSPDLNAVCEHFQGSVRHEYLDHFIIFNEQHLHRVIREYVAYYNTMRPLAIYCG